MMINTGSIMGFMAGSIAGFITGVVLGLLVIWLGVWAMDKDIDESIGCEAQRRGR